MVFQEYTLLNKLILYKKSMMIWLKFKDKHQIKQLKELENNQILPQVFNLLLHYKTIREEILKNYQDFQIFH
jgi:hypothetical protein